jgi:hypothetical protein
VQQQRTTLDTNFLRLVSRVQRVPSKPPSFAVNQEQQQLLDVGVLLSARCVTVLPGVTIVSYSNLCFHQIQSDSTLFASLTFSLPTNTRIGKTHENYIHNDRRLAAGRPTPRHRFTGSLLCLSITLVPSFCTVSPRHYDLPRQSTGRFTAHSI